MKTSSASALLWALERYPELRAAFSKVLKALVEIPEKLKAAHRRSVMRTAYRAKTRRRNRRRK